MLPGKKFGKMEPNPAILRVLAVKTERLQNGSLTKMILKNNKENFGRLSGPFVAGWEGSSEPPEPPWVRACVFPLLSTSFPN